MTTTTETPAVAPGARDAALCRSLIYEALSLGFRPPTEMTRARLATRDAAAALAEAAAVLDAGRGTTLAALTRALAADPGPVNLEDLRRAHARIFGHTALGGVPPYETEYGADTLFEKPQEMGDVAAFLRAFGLTLDPRAHERIDHVSCELEFLAFLLRKEAHALETGDLSMAEETRRAARLFLKDHPGRFLPSFAARVGRADPDGLYGRLAALLLAFVTDECVRLAVARGPEMLRLRLPIDDGAPMACGGAGGCAPGPCEPGDTGDADTGPTTG
jgi:TorA maturation chaperone TorD